MARGQARGAWPPPVEATVEGSLGVETEAGPETVPVSGRARYAGGAYTGNLEARGLGATLTASAEGRGSVLGRLEVDGQSVDLSLLRPEADGIANFHLTASGPIDRLSGNANVDVPELRWNEEPVGPVTVRLEGVLGRGQFTFEAPELRVTGQGTVDRQTLQATLKLDQTEIERVARLVPLTQPVTGVTSGTANVTVPLANPKAAVADARLDTLELVTAGSPRARPSPWWRVSATGSSTSRACRSRATASPLPPPAASASMPPRPSTRISSSTPTSPDPAPGRPHGDGHRARRRHAQRNAGAAARLRRGHPLRDHGPEIRADDRDPRGRPSRPAGRRGRGAEHPRDGGRGSVELTGNIPVAALLPAARAEGFGLTPGVEADLNLHIQDVQAAAVLELLRPGPSPSRRRSPATRTSRARLDPGATRTAR